MKKSAKIENEDESLQFLNEAMNNFDKKYKVQEKH